MNLKADVILTEAYQSPKTGSMYYTMIDQGTGGTIKVTVNGTWEGVKPGDILKLDMQVKPGVYTPQKPMPTQVLNYMHGAVLKANGSKDAA